MIQIINEQRMLVTNDPIIKFLFLQKDVYYLCWEMHRTFVTLYRRGAASDEKCAIPLKNCVEVATWKDNDEKIMVECTGEYCTYDLYTEIVAMEVDKYGAEQTMWRGCWSPRLITMSDGKIDIIKEIIDEAQKI